MTQERTSSFFTKATTIAIALSMTGAAAVSPALAVSGGGSSGGASGTPACKTGQVYDKKKHRCVQSTSSALDDKTLYTQGRDLALAGRYEEALSALQAVSNQNDSMVLTMIGYSKRKLGNFNEGMALYAKALAVDPNNVNTREYLGEAYAEKGKIDLAKAELVKIEALCGTQCEQYRDLAAAIAGTPTGT